MELFGQIYVIIRSLLFCKWALRAVQCQTGSDASCDFTSKTGRKSELEIHQSPLPESSSFPPFFIGGDEFKSFKLFK